MPQMSNTLKPERVSFPLTPSFIRAISVPKFKNRTGKAFGGESARDMRVTFKFRTTLLVPHATERYKNTIIL